MTEIKKTPDFINRLINKEYFEKVSSEELGAGLGFYDENVDDQNNLHDKGMEIIKLLNLKLKSNGRVDTSWGDKTPLGLVRCMQRILEEGGEDVKTYRVDRDINDAQGYQTYQCKAESIDEAVERFNNGDDEFICEEIEVTDLSHVEPTDVYEYKESK